MNYQQWAVSKQPIIKAWGLIPSIAHGWVQDLVNSNPDADAQEAWKELHKLAKG